MIRQPLFTVADTAAGARMVNSDEEQNERDFKDNLAHSFMSGGLDIVLSTDEDLDKSGFQPGV